MAKTNKYDSRHWRNQAAYERQVDAIYRAAAKEAAALGVSIKDFNPDRLFSFSDYPNTRKKIEKLLSGLQSAIEAVIVNGIRSEWTLANNKNDELARQVFGDNVGKLTKEQERRYFSTNGAARDAFIKRKTDGLGLSDRVWKYTSQFKEEIELGLDLGIRSGRSADELSRDLRSYLQHPDKLFRRVRNEHGQLVLSQRAKAYHPGRGVYRSSYKNARRLAATETNIAYRTADYERWQQLDFVVGIEVQLSGNHPVPDICDDLKGRYPKDFKFTGWHPHCRCHVISILKTPEELMADNRRIMEGKEPTVGSVNTVTDVPQAFTDWVRDNSDRISRAKSLPYFIRDNKAVVDSILNPKPTPLEIAKERHAARTPEQIEAIKNRWAERRHKHELIRKTADNVLKAAFDYGEVDYSKLQQLITAGNLTAMQTEARIVAGQVSAFKKQEAALSDLIPDAHGWHKQFSMADLQIVYDRVKSKLDSLSSLTLEEQAEKLQFEIKYVADPSKYKAGAVKYKTWEVSQSAYTKKLASVNYKIDYNAQAEILDEIDKWSKQHPKSLKVKSLLDEASAAWSAKGDMSAIKEKVAAAKDEMDKRIAEQARRDAKKAAKNGGAAFGADAYSKARKNAAMWAKDTQEADNKLRDKCGEVWRNATAKEKDGINGYTEEYHNINEPLRGLQYIGPAQKTQRGLNRIPHIESIINKSSYDFDMWVQRGDDLVALKKFGLSNYATASDAEIKALVGKEGVEGAFWSAGVAKGKGFGGEVIFNIYMPRGTKAMYCEPFSYYGHGVNGKKGMNYDDGIKWDGNNKQKEFGSESEILIQRGTKFRVTKVEKGKNGIWYIDLDVIEQNPVPFPYVGGYPFK